MIEVFQQQLFRLKLFCWNGLFVMATVCLATRLNNVFFNYLFSRNSGLGILFITFLVYLINIAFIINNTI